VPQSRVESFNVSAATSFRYQAPCSNGEAAGIQAARVGPLNLLSPAFTLAQVMLDAGRPISATSKLGSTRVRRFVPAYPDNSYRTSGDLRHSARRTLTHSAPSGGGDDIGLQDYPDFSSKEI
jgi:hypothetical protein